MSLGAPNKDTGDGQCKMPDKPVATRNCFSWQYLLCLQKLANAVDMGFISEADMMDRLNKFGVSGFGVGSRQPRRRSVPDKHLRFGGGPGEEEAVSQPQKRAKVEPVTPSCQQQPSLLSMWCFPVASSSPPVEQSPGQESSCIAAVCNEQSREWTTRSDVVLPLPRQSHLFLVAVFALLSEIGRCSGHGHPQRSRYDGSPQQVWGQWLRRW